MADLQVLPVLPQTPSGGDSGISKSSESGSGEVFGQALTQAKTTVKEKNYHREKQPAAKAEPSKEGPQSAQKKAEKKPKGAEKSAPILPSAPQAQKTADGGSSAIGKNAPAPESRLMEEIPPQTPVENLIESEASYEEIADSQIAAILALSEQVAAININIESALPVPVEVSPEEAGQEDTDGESKAGATHAIKAKGTPADGPRQPDVSAPAVDESKTQRAMPDAPIQTKTESDESDAPKARQVALDVPKAKQTVPDGTERTHRAEADGAEKVQAVKIEDVEVDSDIELAPGFAQKVAQKPAKDDAPKLEATKDDQEKVEGKTESRPARPRPDAEQAHRGQGRPQAGPREPGSMTAEEAGKALAVRSSMDSEAHKGTKGFKALDAAKALEAPALAQADTPKESATTKHIEAPPPIIIESALPRQDKAQSKPAEVAEDVEVPEAAAETKAASQKTARHESRHTNQDRDESTGQPKHPMHKAEPEAKDHTGNTAKDHSKGHNAEAKANDAPGNETRGRAAGRAQRAAAKSGSAPKAEPIATAISSNGAVRIMSEAVQASRATNNGKYQPPIEEIKATHRAPSAQAPAYTQPADEKMEPSIAAETAAAKGQADTVRHGHGAVEAKAATTSTVSVSHTAPFSAPAASAPSQAAPAQVALPTPKMPLPPQAPMSQLDGSVRWLIRNNEKSAEIQLYPEHLGKVIVRLRIEGNEVHARVWASEASTVPMLKEHRTFLENSLKEQGLNLSSFDLQQGRAGHNAQGEGQNQPQGQHYHFAPPMMETWNGNEFRQELPTQLTAQPTDDGRIELYA